MADDFPALVGKIIHHCGALEFLTNNAITALSQDRLLSSEVVKSPFSRRIDILRSLLRTRTDLPPADIKSLCDELREIAERRNEVAHSPIASTDPGNPDVDRIMVVRYTPEKAEIRVELTRADLKTLVTRSCAALQKFAELIPHSTRC